MNQYQARKTYTMQISGTATGFLCRDMAGKQDIGNGNHKYSRHRVRSQRYRSWVQGIQTAGQQGIRTAYSTQGLWDGGKVAQGSAGKTS
ncbi:hypothetical protein GQ472_00615 [archaeon]|nr:hypothetical protein [archaeon]